MANPVNWDNLADLLKSGIRGVEASSGTNTRPLIMIHIDKGGNKNATKYFFDKLIGYDLRFDVIGQSFYPWWHGSLLDLRECLAFIALEYRKDIIVVETAYNWRPAEYRNRKGPFPETPEGQREFLAELNQVVLATPNNRGKGVFWWEPAVPPGRNGRSMFDNEGNALPVISVFDKYTKH
jgi:arabinogalactan endo-1,4-beta-galactosidase